MKKIVPIILILLAGCVSPRERGFSNGGRWSSCVPLETFHLLDSAGKSFGPFQLTNGAPVKVGSEILYVKKVERDAERVENYMKQYTLPEIDFRDAKLEDVLYYFESNSDFGPSDKKKEIEFVILGSGIASLKTTLSIKDTTLYNVFTIVCDIHNLTYRIDDRGVVFVMPQSKEEKRKKPESTHPD